MRSPSVHAVPACARGHRVCMRSPSVHVVTECACGPLGVLGAALNLKAQDRVCNTRNTPALSVEPSHERPPRSTHTPTFSSQQPFTTFNLLLPQSRQPLQPFNLQPLRAFQLNQLTHSTTQQTRSIEASTSDRMVSYSNFSVPIIRIISHTISVLILVVRHFCVCVTPTAVCVHQRLFHFCTCTLPRTVCALLNLVHAYSFS